MSNFYTIKNLLISFCAIIALTGCTGKSGPSIPDTQPDIKGTITTLKRTTSKTKPSVAVVLVETVSGVEAQYPRASIKIDKNTHIEDAQGSVLKVEHLQERQQVEIWFDGTVMESDPVQAHAAAVRIK